MADKMTGEQVQVPCQHCGKDTAVSAFHSLLNMSTVYIAENRDLRAKLETAEAHGEQYRQNWLSLQDLTGEECLDRARYAVKAWKEAAEQLAAATALAEKAEREREELAKRNREWRETADNYATHCGKACEQIEKLEAERDALASQNAALRTALEGRDAQIEHLFRHSGRDGSDCYDALEVSAAWMRLRSPIPALALTPPAAGEAGNDSARLEMEKSDD